MKYYDKKRAAHGWWRVGLGILWIILMIQELELSRKVQSKNSQILSSR